MDKVQFKQFLFDAGYSENACNNNVSYCNTNEKYLCDVEHIAIDLNEIVADPGLMSNAISLIRSIEFSGTSNRKNSLRLYYYFRNKVWFDSWRPQKISPSREKRNIKVKKGMVYWQIPSKLSDFYEYDNPYVKYDREVSNDEKLQGLPAYLTDQLDNITFNKCRYILGDIIHVFNDRNTLPFIPVVLSNELPIDVFHESDEYIARKIVTSNRSYKEILEILKYRDKTDRILGEYHHSGCPTDLGFNIDNCFRFEDGSIPYITIYYKNTICVDSEEYKKLFGNCLAHEYFHFIHDVYAPIEFKKKNAKAKAVKEGLADFFSLVYSFERNILDICLEKVIKRKYDAWVDRFGSGWPYAFAYYFYLIDGRQLGWTSFVPDYHSFGSVDKFNRVLAASRDSMDEAYKILTTK